MTTFLDYIAICEDLDPTSCEDFESDKSDEEEPSTEDTQKAYQKMYDNWIKVCDVNKSLKDKKF